MTDSRPAAAGEPRLGRLRLVAVKGDSEGARMETSGAVQSVTIGRNPTNDLFLRDKTVSRQNAVIEPTPEGWRLVPRPNSALVMCAGRAVGDEGVLLSDGDEIKLGLAAVSVTIEPVADEDDFDRTVRFKPSDVPSPSAVPPGTAPPRQPPREDVVVPLRGVPQPPSRVEAPHFEPTGGGPRFDRPAPLRADPPQATRPAAAEIAAAQQRTPRAETPRERFARFDVFTPMHESAPCRLDRAMDSRSGDPVTLRRLSAPLGFFARRRFMRAVERLRGIEHENLLAPLEAGRADQELFIVYPALEGVSAGVVLREGRRDLPIELAAYIVREAARGLAQAAHAAGPALHLALGDGDVVCRRDGAVVLLLAPFVAVASEADRYRAPEDAAGRAVDVRAAIFSLGVLLWELLAREPVLPGHQMTLRSVDAVRIQVPPTLAAATMCAVEVRAEHRFAHPDELADVLAAELQRLSPGYGPEAAARWLREHVPTREGELW
jgi:hypothetical protein